MMHEGARGADVPRQTAGASGPGRLASSRLRAQTRGTARWARIRHVMSGAATAAMRRRRPRSQTCRWTPGRGLASCASIVMVRNWIRSGKLKAFRPPGSHYRVPIGEFRRFGAEYGFLAGTWVPPGILIVDDDPDIMLSACDTLGRLQPSPKLETAGDGYEGPLKIGTFRPDLLVLDLRMPGLDGFEVCRRIKADPATHATRIPVIPDCCEDTAKARAFECGADAFLPKPFSVTKLAAQVKKLLKPTG